MPCNLISFLRVALSISRCLISSLMILFSMFADNVSRLFSAVPETGRIPRGIFRESENTLSESASEINRFAARPFLLDHLSPRVSCRRSSSAAPLALYKPAIISVPAGLSVFTMFAVFAIFSRLTMFALFTMFKLLSFKVLSLFTLFSVFIVLDLFTVLTAFTLFILLSRLSVLFRTLVLASFAASVSLVSSVLSAARS